MKKTIFVLFAIIFLGYNSNAQTNTSALQKNKEFTGAKATNKMYHAIYQLDKNDPKVIGKTIRNINNALTDPRLKGKLQIELIAFSGGTDAYLKGGKFENDLKALAEKGVIIAQCENTLHERNISRDQIYDFIGVVPSGNGELIIRQAEGWSVVKP
jgi:intracellular sulfur oxidation DsrE/DsrF family protein